VPTHINRVSPTTELCKLLSKIKNATKAQRKRKAKNTWKNDSEKDVWTTDFKNSWRKTDHISGSTGQI